MAGDLKGYHFAAYCLRHSLEDYPSDLYYGPTSDVAKQIKSSKAYKDLLKNAVGITITNILKTNEHNNVEEYNIIIPMSDIINEQVPLAFESSDSADLFLALYHTTAYITVKANPYGGRTVNVRIKDKYDFGYDKQNYAKSIGLINNAAYIAQYIGAIHSYYIIIDMPTESF